MYLSPLGKIVFVQIETRYHWKMCSGHEAKLKSTAKKNCWNFKLYLSKLQNIVVQIVHCICSNYKMISLGNFFEVWHQALLHLKMYFISVFVFLSVNCLFECRLSLSWLWSWLWSYMVMVSPGNVL